MKMDTKHTGTSSSGSYKLIQKKRLTAASRLKGKGIENKERWTSKNIMRLIETLHKFPSLWDPKHPDYRVRSKRHQAYVELANIFLVSVGDIKKKIENLRTVYNRNRNAIQCKSVLGEATATKWFAYDAMDNLLSSTYEPTTNNQGAGSCAEDESQSAITSSSPSPKRKHTEVIVETSPINPVKSSNTVSPNCDSEELGCAFLATLLRTSKRSESDKLKFIFHMQKCFYEFEKGSLNMD
uniref:MADF domain-containing protein n=1 Tax=Anopheles albimanus TaxID=7167 RepID=A0A182FCA9_ANOAL